jgi:hypothetical protein
VANNLRDVYTGVKQNDPDRRANDFYPTPPVATYVLGKYCTPPRNVFEPCAGRGNISVQLARMGHNVLSHDLNSYEHSLCSINTSHDALTEPKVEFANAVVTNPPYHKQLPRLLATKWIEEYDYVAMFVRLTFLEGKKRKNLFTNNPPSDIIFLSDRVRFTDKNIEPIEKEDQIGGMIAYIWIVWNKNAPHDNTKTQWVNLEDEYDEWKTTLE